MLFENQNMWLKIAFGLSVAGGLSACSSVPPNYETVTSNAAVTSTLAGSAIVTNSVSDASSAGVAHITGSYNHRTGALRLESGTYVFVDGNGPGSGGCIADGGGATCITDFAISGVPHMFDYVDIYRITSSGEAQAGVMGIVTKAADMPSGGTATYTAPGTAMFQTANLSGTPSAAETYLSWGVSTVNADFAAGTATVDMSSFTDISDGNGASYAAGAAPADEVRGTGLVISGAHLSGGTWQTLKGGVPVNLLGTGAVATSDGNFFGYDPTLSAPDEVGGVVLIKGATQFGFGLYIAD